MLPSISSFNKFFQDRSCASITGNTDTLLAVVEPLWATFSRYPPNTPKFHRGHKELVEVLNGIFQRINDDFQQPSKEIQKISGFEQYLNLRFFLQQNNHHLEAMGALLGSLTIDLRNPQNMTYSDEEYEAVLISYPNPEEFVSKQLEFLGQATLEAGFIFLVLGHKIQYQGKVLTASYINGLIDGFTILFDSLNNSYLALKKTVESLLIYWLLEKNFEEVENMIQAANSYATRLRQNLEHIERGVSLEEMEWISVNFGSHN